MRLKRPTQGDQGEQHFSACLGKQGVQYWYLCQAEVQHLCGPHQELVGILMGSSILSSRCSWRFAWRKSNALKLCRLTAHFPGSLRIPKMMAWFHWIVDPKSCVLQVAGYAMAGWTVAA